MKKVILLFLALNLLPAFSQGGYDGGSCSKGSIDLNVGLNAYIYEGIHGRYARDYFPIGFGVSADFGLMPMLSLGVEGGMGFYPGDLFGYAAFRPLFHFGAFFLPNNMDLQTGFLAGVTLGRGWGDFLFDWEVGYKWWFSEAIGLNVEIAVGTSASHVTAGVSFKLN